MALGRFFIGISYLVGQFGPFLAEPFLVQATAEIFSKLLSNIILWSLQSLYKEMDTVVGKRRGRGSLPQIKNIEKTSKLKGKCFFKRDSHLIGWNDFLKFSVLKFGIGLSIGFKYLL